MTSGGILVVGSTGGSHIGGSLVRAAESLGITAEICDAATAWRLGTVKQRFLWHFCGRRPPALTSFSQAVIEKCQSFRPETIVTTGMAPLAEHAIVACRNMGVRCVNFSTDDPFNPLMHAPWFRRALRVYDTIFSPRRANLEELRAHGCADVRYLPFGYDPTLFYAPRDCSVESKQNDLFFAGTAEPSRVPYISEALSAGLEVRLHGHSWNRYRNTRRIALGQADIATLRDAIVSCKVALCLVRHQNRDGHSMRSYEVPAVGACMVVEDTPEHRTMFGDDGERVAYFSNPESMVDRTRTLLGNPGERARLKRTVHNWIISGSHTYADRLKVIIKREPL
jgi:spore maturation protein CgeB